MKGETQIRVAEIGHLESLVRLVAGFRDELGRSGPSDGKLREEVRGLLERGEAEFFVALENDGACVGYIQQRYRYSIWVSGLEACIEDLFITPDVRQTGVGSRLVEYALARARAKGCRAATLDTNELNEPAIRLYRRLGFSCGSSRFPGGKQLWFERSL